MKATTIHALLLSLVAMAGVAATDAYAQTNTERLQDIHEDVPVIKEIVEAIQSALATLGEQIDVLITSMTSVETSVTDMSSKISGFETTIDTRLTGVETALSEISSSLAAGSGVDVDSTLTTTALNDLINGISRINARLGDIENRMTILEIELTGVATQVSTPTPITATPARGNLVESTVQKDITAYNYKQSGKKQSDRNSFNYYDLDLTFSCNNDVFVDNVRMIQRIGDTEEYLNRGANYDGGADMDGDMDRDVMKAPDGTNYVLVNGRSLYHNWFEVSEDKHIEYNPKLLDFDNMPLRSNQALSFETRVYDGNFSTTDGIYNSTDPAPGTERLIEHAPKPTPRDDMIDEPTELYTLEVTYRTYYLNTSCSLNFGKAGSSGFNVDTASTLTFGTTIDDGTGILKDFEDVIDCGGNPVEITGVTTATVDEWNDSISSFAKMYMTVEDGVDDENPDATFTFDSQGRAELNEGDYPVFGNSDLKVHGTLPAAEGLLISIEYLSVSANVCEKTTPTS